MPSSSDIAGLDREALAILVEGLRSWVKPHHFTVAVANARWERLFRKQSEALTEESDAMEAWLKAVDQVGEAPSRVLAQRVRDNLKDAYERAKRRVARLETEVSAAHDALNAAHEASQRVDLGLAEA